MKKIKGIIAIGLLSIMLIAGASTTIACEGLTPGYWKNHPDDWYSLDPDQTIGSVFIGLPSSVPSSITEATLMEALSFKGGNGFEGAVRILLRSAVAALLNHYHPDIEYEIGAGLIITRVNNAISSGERFRILSLKDQFDEWNNRGLLD